MHGNPRYSYAVLGDNDCRQNGGSTGTASYNPRYVDYPPGSPSSSFGSHLASPTNTAWQNSPYRPSGDYGSMPAGEWYGADNGSPRDGEGVNEDRIRRGDMVTEERMRQGLVVGVQQPGRRVALFADWLFYMTSNHVLLSAVCFPQPHPYSLQRRRLVCATSLAFAFFLAVVLLLAGYALPAVPRDYSVSKMLLARLNDWPNTLSVMLQLLWDVSGASLSTCACVRIGPLSFRKACSVAMLCCLACQQVAATRAAHHIAHPALA